MKSSMYLLMLFKLICLYTWKCLLIVGFSGGSDGKESACNAGEPCWIPGWGGVPREGKLPTPVFLPGESHGQRSLLGYMGYTESKRVSDD